MNRQTAQLQAKEIERMQEEVLDNKVNEILRRAKSSFDRKHYDRAAVDAWNAYQLDRRREDARILSSKLVVYAMYNLMIGIVKSGLNATRDSTRICINY